MFLSHIGVSLPLFPLPFPPSKKVNKSLKKSVSVYPSSVSLGSYKAILIYNNFREWKNETE